MNRKVAVAAGSAVASVVLALGASLGVASATEDPHSGQCNNYGNVMIAPFCGATFGSTPAPTTRPVDSLTRGFPTGTSARPTTTTRQGELCPAIFPPLPGCPGYTGPGPIPVP